MRAPIAAFAFLSAITPITAQANTIAGTDGRLTDIHSPTYFGRRGASHPGGEVGIAYAYYMCNTGSVTIPWEGPFNGPQPMPTDHPLWSFLVARETDGRMVQVSTRDTFVKHATSAANTASYCNNCQPSGTFLSLGTGCGDAYSATTNANRFWLGPQGEVDPWLATWNPIGSYFDRGDPESTFPDNQDGVRTLTSAQVAAMTDPVKNRVTLRESELVTPGRFLYSMQMLVRGEAAANRGDNLMYREMTPVWDGGSGTWSFTDAAPAAHGSVLSAWQGATVASGRNGNTDGTMTVGVKVTGPQAGRWHYEYAVHNVDNGRGAATLRIPLCAGAVPTNVGFRDVDADPLNDWTWTVTGGELVFQATANNELKWNELFNFWFDIGHAPADGTVALDQALPGPGAAQVQVTAPVPSTTAVAASMGPGCGTPSPVITANGRPTIPNSGFRLQFSSSPNAAMLVFVSMQSANLPIGPGCTQYLGFAGLQTHTFLLANNGGNANMPLPIPNSMVYEGLELYWQAGQLLAGGPVLGQFTVSNGFMIKLGCR